MCSKTGREVTELVANGTAVKDRLTGVNVKKTVFGGERYRAARTGVAKADR